VLLLRFGCWNLQYTFILTASKNLPSQVVDFRKGKTRQRKSVGVRMPDDPICKVRMCWTYYLC
jgi:tRNA A37 threonylcarbamoyladenosine synthetase subunit TsaC/SUA5/YrdC